MGASVSLRAIARFGSTLAVFDFVHLGSSLAMRSFARCGTYLSVQDTIHTKDLTSDGQMMYHYASGGYLTASQSAFGDMFVTLAEVKGSLVAQGGVAVGTQVGAQVNLDGYGSNFRVQFDGQNQRILTYAGGNIRQDIRSTGGSLHGIWSTDAGFTAASPLMLHQDPVTRNASFSLVGMNGTAELFWHDSRGELAVKVRSQALMSIANHMSQLHGSWSASQIVTISDREMKREIRPLREVLTPATQRRHLQKTNGDTYEMGWGSNWLLRQLQPVSFRWRHSARDQGSIDERPRYGFVAQEIEEVLPGVVRQLNDISHSSSGRPHLGVVYQDLIAVLVASQQEQLSRLEQMEHWLSGTEARLVRAEENVRLVYLKVAEFIGQKSRRRPFPKE